MTKKMLSLVSLVCWISIWELLVVAINDRSIFPQLPQILSNTLKLISDTDFIFKHFLQSMYRLGIALCFAIPAAYFFSLISIKSKFVDSFITTFVGATFPLPKIALLPLFLVFFGIGDLTKIVLIALSVFYLVFINTYEGIKKIATSELADVVKVYKVQGLNYWFDFLVKGSFPYFLIGLRSGLGYGLTMVVVSEYSLSNNGLGYFIWSSWDQFRVLDMYSGIFIIALLGLTLYGFCSQLIERYRVRI